MDLHDSDEGSIQVVSLSFLGVQDIHSVGTSRNGEDRLGGREGGGEGEREAGNIYIVWYSKGPALVWLHEMEPWFHSWYRGRVETLDAKYNLGLHREFKESYPTIFMCQPYCFIKVS